MSKGKSEQIEDMLDVVTKKAFGRSRTESKENSICVICGSDAIKFRDAISRREYGISGMCQICQDGFFSAK